MGAAGTMVAVLTMSSISRGGGSGGEGDCDGDGDDGIADAATGFAFFLPPAPVTLLSTFPST